jgi:hypothetical protein
MRVLPQNLWVAGLFHPVADIFRLDLNFRPGTANN